MPKRPKRPCSYPGCGRLTDGRYCDEAFNNTQANCQGKTGYQASYSMTFIGNDMVFDAEKNDYQKIWLVKKY